MSRTRTFGVEICAAGLLLLPVARAAAAPVSQPSHPASGGAINDYACNNDARNAAGLKADCLQVHSTFGGSGVQGGRNLIEGDLHQTAATAANNADRNYVGVQGVSLTTSGDGGTLTNPKGAYFGLSGLAACRGGVFLLNCTAAEFNTEIVRGVSVFYRSGIQIASAINSRGYAEDCALCFGEFNGLYGDKNIISITDKNGTFPTDTDTTLFNVEGSRHGSIANFLYSPKTPYSGYIIRTPGIGLTEHSMSMQNPGSSFEIGSLMTASQPYMDWHSSGNTNDYDARFLFSGGSSHVGRGIVTIYASAVSSAPDGTTIVNGFRQALSYAPKSNSACAPGDRTWDANYEYICVAPNKWKRAALSDF